MHIARVLLASSSRLSAIGNKPAGRTQLRLAHRNKTISKRTEYGQNYGQRINAFSWPEPAEFLSLLSERESRPPKPLRIAQRLHWANGLAPSPSW